MFDHLIVQVFLMSLIIFQKIHHWIQTRELLNRLMARNFPELVTWENEGRKGKIPDKIKHKDGIPL